MKKITIFLIAIISLFFNASAQNAVSAPDKLKGRALTLRDFGSDDLGFLSLPETAPTVGILIVHDSIGLDNKIRAYCDAVAASGAVALAVDLYNGKIAEDKDQSIQLQTGIVKSSAIKTIQAGVQLLAESPQWKTEHVIVIAFGRQAEISLVALEKARKEVSGLVWVEPEGEVDDGLFKRSSIPLKVIANGKPQDPNAFIAHMESILTKERLKLVFVERFNGSKGFFLAPQKSDAQTKARARVVDFWKECADGKYQDERNIFQKWIDKINN